MGIGCISSHHVSAAPWLDDIMSERVGREKTVWFGFEIKIAAVHFAVKLAFHDFKLGINDAKFLWRRSHS